MSSFCIFCWSFPNIHNVPILNVLSTVESYLVTYQLEFKELINYVVNILHIFRIFFSRILPFSVYFFQDFAHFQDIFFQDFAHFQYIFSRILHNFRIFFPGFCTFSVYFFQDFAHFQDIFSRILHVFRIFFPGFCTFSVYFFQYFAHFQDSFSRILHIFRIFFSQDFSHFQHICSRIFHIFSIFYPGFCEFIKELQRDEQDGPKTTFSWVEWRTCREHMYTRYCCLSGRGDTSRWFNHSVFVPTNCLSILIPIWQIKQIKT